MILKQLKQLTLSATRRNADVLWLPRFYSSPDVCQSLTTTKSYKRLSRDDRRAVVESFVSEYRAANAGKFPTLKATVKEVGGGYYTVRDILQELKLKPNAPLPIVAKALSEVPSSVPIDASSQTLNDVDTDPQSHTSACNVEHVSPVVADPVFQGNNNLVVTATHDKRETETATPSNDVDSKCDSNTHLPKRQTSKEAEKCLKNSETEEEEPKADHLEGAAVSSNVLPTETSIVSEKEDGNVKTGENSSTWSNIISFAKEFANFWRKG